MKRITVIDYGLANIRSIVNALECFRVTVEIAADGTSLRDAEAIVLPGVGSFDAGMRGLRERDHVDALEDAVRGRGVPFLGICLGMQFLLEGSEEGDEPGLGWLPGVVRRFPTACGIKVPHMGWSEVVPPRKSGLFSGLAPPYDFYFVHSYYVSNEGAAASAATAVCEHGVRFVAALEDGNVAATQFHPEKSQLAGMKLLETFIASP